MHNASDLNLRRGYEWWLLSEAKKRNPSLLTFGLSWAWPAWVGCPGGDLSSPDCQASPYAFPNQTAAYIVEWVAGAKSAYNVSSASRCKWARAGSSCSVVISALLLRFQLMSSGAGTRRRILRVCASKQREPVSPANLTRSPPPPSPPVQNISSRCAVRSMLQDLSRHAFSATVRWRCRRVYFSSSRAQSPLTCTRCRFQLAMRARHAEQPSACRRGRLRGRPRPGYSPRRCAPRKASLGLRAV